MRIPEMMTDDKELTIPQVPKKIDGVPDVGDLLAWWKMKGRIVWLLKRCNRPLYKKGFHQLSSELDFAIVDSESIGNKSPKDGIEVEELKESFKQFLLTRDADDKDEDYDSPLGFAAKAFAEYLCWLTGVESDWDNYKGFIKELKQGR